MKAKVVDTILMCFAVGLFAPLWRKYSDELYLHCNCVILTTGQPQPILIQLKVLYIISMFFFMTHYTHLLSQIFPKTKLELITFTSSHVLINDGNHYFKK